MNNITNTTTNSTSTDTSTPTIDDVYQVVEFSDFQYCQAGCWLTIVVLAFAVSTLILRPTLARILPNVGQLPIAVGMVLLEIASDALEVLYAILGVSKVLHASHLTVYHRAWLALSSIGFGVGGLLELVGLGDAFCRRTWFDRLLGGRCCCGCLLLAPSQEDEVTCRLEQFPRLSDRMRWAWFRRGVWWEVVFLYLCFSLLATVVLPQGGFVIWILYPLGTMVVSCGLRRVDPSQGEGATAFLFPRALEAIVITTPLLIIEVLATQSLGFVTGALLVRDALEIVWTIVDFCQPPAAVVVEQEEPNSVVMTAKGKIQEVLSIPSKTISSITQKSTSELAETQQPPSVVMTTKGRLQELMAAPSKAMSSITKNLSSEEP